MRIAVCDDLQEERARLCPMLREYLTEREILADLTEFSGGEALLGAFTPGLFSLAFLDIYMEGITGVETARRLKCIDPNCAVIFTTTSREHGADAFDVDAFYYLVKPIDKAKLFSVLGKWYDMLCEASTIQLKCGRALRSVFLNDILYIDVCGRNSTVHTAAEQVETSMSLAALEALLPKGQFCRPIRYCLAAMRHIRTIRDNEILLDNGETLAISRLEKENLRQQLASYRLRTLRHR